MKKGGNYKKELYQKITNLDIKRIQKNKNLRLRNNLLQKIKNAELLKIQNQI